MGMRVVSTWIKWAGQEADSFHLGLKLRMNGAVLHLSLNVFLVMIASKQIILPSYVGCPIPGMWQGQWPSWQKYFVVSLSHSWQTMGYCKLGGGHFHNPRKIFANQHTISVKTSVVC